jgi:hypothetical protein
MGWKNPYTPWKPGEQGAGLTVASNAGQPLPSIGGAVGSPSFSTGVAGGAGGAIDLNTLLQRFSGGAGAPGASAAAPLPGVGVGGAGGAGGAAGSVSNLSTVDPTLMKYVGSLQKRIDDPMGATGRAIDVATSKIRDAAEGQRKQLTANASSRGVLAGSSIPEMGEAAISDKVMRDVAGAATDITLGREKANDDFLLGAGAGMRAPGEEARANATLGLNQWEAQQADQRARDAQGLQAWMANMDMLTKVLQLA